MMSENEVLEMEFSSGTTPKHLNGFYEGKLETLYPGNIFESIGKVVANIYLPWKGKFFYLSKHTGDNLIPNTSKLPLVLIFGKDATLKQEKNGFHAFTFKTKVTRGIMDNINVLQLNYDLPQNPPTIRRIVDELMCIKEDVYLGKAHIKEGKTYRTVAFFRLQR